MTTVRAAILLVMQQDVWLRPWKVEMLVEDIARTPEGIAAHIKKTSLIGVFAELNDLLAAGLVERREAREQIFEYRLTPTGVAAREWKGSVHLVDNTKDEDDAAS